MSEPASADEPIDHTGAREGEPPGLDPQAQPVAGGQAEGEPAQGEGAPNSH